MVSTVKLIASLIDDSSQDGALQTVIKQTLNKDVKCLKVKVRKVCGTGLSISFLCVNTEENMPYTTPMIAHLTIKDLGVSCTLTENKQEELQL